MAARKSYRFTFGPWNISTGRDPFGPEVRKEVAFATKIREYKKLGFDGVQFHDDDVVPRPRRLGPESYRKPRAKVKKMLDGEGLFCRVHRPAPVGTPEDRRRRLHVQQCRRSQVRHGALPSGPSTSPTCWARTTSSCGWREGTYIREAKDPMASIGRILDAVNALLEYDKYDPHPRRDEAERADGSGLSADAGPLPGHRPTRRPSRRASAC